MQKAKKLKTLKRLESKERRTITQINHVISKQLVQLAVDYDCGIRLEDLSKIRKTSKQRKKNKSDAAQNRDFWCYYQLENFIFYKAQLAGIPVEKVPAAFTSNYPIQKIIYKQQQQQHKLSSVRSPPIHRRDELRAGFIGLRVYLVVQHIDREGCFRRDEHIQQRDCRWRDGVHKGAGLTSSGGNLQRQPLARQPRGTTPRNLATPLGH